MPFVVIANSSAPLSIMQRLKLPTLQNSTSTVQDPSYPFDRFGKFEGGAIRKISITKLFPTKQFITNL
jgi:hypothetical protein